MNALVVTCFITLSIYNINEPKENKVAVINKNTIAYMTASFNYYGRSVTKISFVSDRPVPLESILTPQQIEKLPCE